MGVGGLTEEDVLDMSDFLITQLKRVEGGSFIKSQFAVGLRSRVGRWRRGMLDSLGVKRAKGLEDELAVPLRNTKVGEVRGRE